MEAAGVPARGVPCCRGPGLWSRVTLWVRAARVVLLAHGPLWARVLHGLHEAVARGLRSSALRGGEKHSGFRLALRYPLPASDPTRPRAVFRLLHQAGRRAFYGASGATHGGDSGALVHAAP